MGSQRRRKDFGGGMQPATELLLLTVLMIDKLTELYRQSGRT
jgi:hypothetical protein